MFRLLSLARVAKACASTMSSPQAPLLGQAARVSATPALDFSSGPSWVGQAATGGHKGGKKGGSGKGPSKPKYPSDSFTRKQQGMSRRKSFDQGQAANSAGAPLRGSPTDNKDSKGRFGSADGSTSNKSRGSKSSLGSHKGKSSRGGDTRAPTACSVKMDKSGHRFTLDLGNGQEACIDYKPAGRNKIELHRIAVPIELRGMGIGRALAKGALEQAAKNSLRVRITDEYLVKNLDRYADSRLKKIIE